MARLPDFQALGERPSLRTGRRIASYDTTAEGQGEKAAALGEVDQYRREADGQHSIAQGHMIEAQAAGVEGDAARIRGRAKMQTGEAISRMGDTFGRISSNLQAEAEQQKAKQNQLDAARADADFLTGRAKINAERDNDLNPDDLDKRYGPRYEENLLKASQHITDPQARELFYTRRSVDLTNDQIATQSRKQGLERERSLANAQQQLDDLRDAGLKETDEGKRTEIVRTGQGIIKGLVDNGYIDPTKGQALSKGWVQGYIVGTLESMDPGERAAALRGNQPLNERSKQAFDFFTKQGWSKEQAAGIVGNLIAESQLTTHARAVGDGSDGSDSIGIAQWNADRAERLKRFAAARGTDWKDFQTQLEFVDLELRTTHASDKLASAKTAREASEAFITDFEKPAGSNRGAQFARNYHGRVGNAQRVFEAYGSGSSEPPAGLLTAGNIDLNARPIVKNADGSISTVRSMSINVDGKEVLIPTVAADGSGILSDKEAIAQYRKTGQHLGIFDTPKHATAYAESLHEQQAKQYARKPGRGEQLASLLPEEKRRDLLVKADQEEESRALKLQREDDSQQRTQVAEINRRMVDDLTSMEKTGQGNPNLSRDMIAQVGGEEAAATWEKERDRSLRVYKALSGIEELPEYEVDQRLAQLEPKPGTDGYVDDMKAYERARTKADKFLQARRADPALAVEALPVVKEARNAAQYEGQGEGKRIAPESAQAIIGARLAAQKTLGIEAPLAVTKAEARVLARQLRYIGADDTEALERFDRQLHNTYGDYADEVLSAVLQHENVNRDLSVAATEVLGKLGVGKIPDISSVRRLDNQLEANALQQAIEGKATVQPAGVPFSQAPAADSPGNMRRAAAESFGTNPPQSAAKAPAKAQPQAIGVIDPEHIRALVTGKIDPTAFDIQYGAPGLAQRIIKRARELAPKASQ